MTDNNEQFIQQQLAAAAAISNQTKQTTNQINYGQLGLQNTSQLGLSQNQHQINQHLQASGLENHQNLELLNGTTDLTVQTTENSGLGQLTNSTTTGLDLESPNGEGKGSNDGGK